MSEFTGTYRPSAALLRAVSQALNTMAVVWPRAMALATDTSEDGLEYQSQFAYAMKGAALDAIPIATREWIANHKYQPTPAEFGKLAREITREHFPTVTDQLKQHPSYEPAFSAPKDNARINALGRRAFDALGSWRLVGEVWALLVHTAPHEDHRQAARDGKVPSDVFDDAIAQVKAGRRAPVGPLEGAA